jgi:lipopolysaccharide/colanic/teichoic acid biosynthesis glycosyltransferase
LTYDETVTYDLEYVNHHSVLTDVQILAKTALTVVRASGAR